MADPFDYIESRADADELIEEFGGVASLRHVVTSGPVAEPIETPTDYPTFAVRIEFTLRQMQAGNVQETDERWLVAAGPLDRLGVTNIATPDTLVVGTAVKPILVSKPLQPATVVVLWDCHIRF